MPVLNLLRHCVTWLHTPGRVLTARSWAGNEHERWLLAPRATLKCLRMHGVRPRPVAFIANSRDSKSSSGAESGSNSSAQASGPKPRPTLGPERLGVRQFLLETAAPPEPGRCRPSSRECNRPNLLAVSKPGNFGLPRRLRHGCAEASSLGRRGGGLSRDVALQSRIRNNSGLRRRPSTRSRTTPARVLLAQAHPATGRASATVNRNFRAAASEASGQVPPSIHGSPPSSWTARRCPIRRLWPFASSAPSTRRIGRDGPLTRVYGDV